MAYYLVTYYIKNTNEKTKDVFKDVPYKSFDVEFQKEKLLQYISAYFAKNPFVSYCTVMEKNYSHEKEYYMNCSVENPYYMEKPIKHDYKHLDADDVIVNDALNKVHMVPYESLHKGFEVNLESEQKVIRLGASFYDLKGVLICEATEEDKKKYFCEKYVTFPIVDDDWRVYDGDEVRKGIELLTVGKKGDTLPLAALRDAADFNARENWCNYEDQLVDLERHGITISNRIAWNSAEEFSDTIVIGIDKQGDKSFRMDSDWGGYYIPRRFFHVGKDDELYEIDEEGKPSPYQQKLVTRIVDDVWGLSWFFNKPNLRVLITAITENGFGFVRDKLGPIPKDWFYTVQTLEAEINRELDKMHQEYPDDYNRSKRPDIIKK
jgi:hypothetical protein